MPSSKVKISRILHAGFIFEFEGQRIIFDPLFENPFSQNCYAFPEVDFDLTAIPNLKCDAIIISHYHDDHFSLESLKLIPKETPIYFFSVFEELFDLIKQLGFTSVHPITLGKPLHFGNLNILPLEALDSDVDSIFHIQAGDLNILHVVDSWIGINTWEKLIQTKTWDLALWPFQTMREIEVISPVTAEVTSETTLLPPEWTEQIQQLNPKAVIPSSCQFKFEDWSWQNQAFFPISYQSFEMQMENILPDTKIIRLDPGEVLDLEKNHLKKTARLNWIRPKSSLENDYHFNPNVKPQTVSEIAKHFPKLNFSELDFVLSYCKMGITKRFSELSEVFEEPLKWKLLIYDQTGSVTQFNYKINGLHMTLDASDSFETDWTTEICDSKLHQALTNGESLTSIYVRVNPSKNEDPMLDPLIRCLYEGIIGGYQKAQLKKILSKS